MRAGTCSYPRPARNNHLRRPMALAVAQRRREIGIRLAVGARPPQVALMFLASGVRLIGLGLALGLPVSLLGFQMLLRDESVPPSVGHVGDRRRHRAGNPAGGLGGRVAAGAQSCAGRSGDDIARRIGRDGRPAITPAATMRLAGSVCPLSRLSCARRSRTYGTRRAKRPLPARA